MITFLGLWVGVLAVFVRALGGVVTSHFRSAAENAAVGGSPTSLHLRGEALDLSLTSSERAVDFLRAFGVVSTHHKGTAPHLHFEPDQGRALVLASGLLGLAVLARRARPAYTAHEGGI